MRASTASPPSPATSSASPTTCTGPWQALDDELRAKADEGLKALLDGVELTERELINVLEKHGVKRIEPLGQKFDPNRHQAMFEVEDASVPSGSVVQVMQAGYLIGDRVLRPALVAVAKGGAKARAGQRQSHPIDKLKAYRGSRPSRTARKRVNISGHLSFGAKPRMRR